ncbi:MAG: hypothetical protein ABEI98_02525 [Halorhabdus sp.]
MATSAMSGTAALGERFAERHFGVSSTQMQQSVAAKTIARVLVTVAIAIVILNEVFTLDSIQNSTGPFSGLVDTVENLGTAALTLAVLGLIALGGAVAMNYMDRF